VRPATAPSDNAACLAFALRTRAELIIAESARKHGVSDEDIRHAYAHPIRVFGLDEGRTMIIGANQAAIIYEIGVETASWRLSSYTR
jgi:hypothetical protein